VTVQFTLVNTIPPFSILIYLNSFRFAARYRALGTEVWGFFSDPAFGWLRCSTRLSRQYALS
jgi:hypothetical protein